MTALLVADCGVRLSAERVGDSFVCRIPDGEGWHTIRRAIVFGETKLLFAAAHARGGDTVTVYLEKPK